MTHWGRAPWRRKWRVWDRWKRRWARVAGPMVALLLVLGASSAVLLAPLVIDAARRHPYFRVRTLEVEGVRRLSPADVAAWLDWKDGTSVWAVDPDTLRARLLAHPWVRGATVRRILPRRVRVHVRERRPVALLLTRGSFHYVDRTGRVLGPLLPGEAPDLPVISGVDEFEDRELSAVQVHRALHLLRVCERLRCLDDISQVQISKRGLVVVPLRTRVAVVLGWGNLEEKLRRSARVFAAWEGRTEQLRQVDVSLPHGAVLKLAPTPPAVKGRSKQRPGRSEA